MYWLFLFCGFCMLPHARAVPSCDCAWAEDGVCGQNNGDDCWYYCCGFQPLRRFKNETSNNCKCAWTKGGILCTEDDGGECWETCCGHVERCNHESLITDHSPYHCMVEDGAMTMYCPTKNSSKCGMRMSSKVGYGSGTYSADVKAAPGSGLVTTIYVFSFGRSNSKSDAWNEIDFEILGHQIEAHSTRIWTNYFYGKGWEWPEFITVPFNVSEEFHNYAIEVDCTAIKWIVDGITYRTQPIHLYGDFQCTLDKQNFQLILSLWGQTTRDSTNWKEMGFLDDRNVAELPLKGSFKNIKLPARGETNNDANCKCSPGFSFFDHAGPIDTAIAGVGSVLVGGVAIAAMFR